MVPGQRISVSVSHYSLLSLPRQSGQERHEPVLLRGSELGGRTGADRADVDASAAVHSLQPCDDIRASASAVTDSNQLGNHDVELILQRHRGLDVAGMECFVQRAVETRLDIVRGPYRAIGPHHQPRQRHLVRPSERVQTVPAGDAKHRRGWAF